MSKPNYDEIVDDLARAMLPLGMPEGQHDTLIVYLVGYAVSLLQERTEARRQEVLGLLGDVVAKHKRQEGGDL